jgi:hypothetical protein
MVCSFLAQVSPKRGSILSQLHQQPSRLLHLLLKADGWCPGCFFEHRLPLLSGSGATLPCPKQRGLLLLLLLELVQQLAMALDELPHGLPLCLRLARGKLAHCLGGCILCQHIPGNSISGSKELRITLQNVVNG